MGLGTLLTRGDQRIDVTVTDVDAGTSMSESFTVIDGLVPDWGGSAAAYRGGMGLPGAWRASLLLADLLGAAPWHAYRDVPGGPAQRQVPNLELLRQPCPPEVRISSFSSMALDLIWHGNGIALITSRDAEGRPLTVLPRDADRVYVSRANGHDDTELPRGEIGYRIGGRWFSAHDVLHVKGPSRPGALRGMGVLEAHLAGTLKLSTELQRQAAEIGASGVPTMTIKVSAPDLQPSEAAALKAQAIASQRTRSPMVLNATTDAKPLSWNPSEQQLLDARKFSLHETALIFGIPLSFLGVEQSSRTYTNVEQEGLNLLKYSLGGHLARFEQTFEAALPPDEFVLANLDAVLRADTLTRYQAHEIALRSGFLVDDEVRAFENRQPLTPEQRELIAARKVTSPSEGSK